MGTVWKVGRPWTACGRGSCSYYCVATLASEFSVASEMRTENIPRWGWTNCSLEKMSKDKRPMHRSDGSPQPHFKTFNKLLPLGRMRERVQPLFLGEWGKGSSLSSWENERKRKHIKGLLSRNEVWSLNRPTEFPREQDLRLNIVFN